MECSDCQGAIASKLAPARNYAFHKLEDDDAKPVGAGLPAKRPAHSLQNSKHPTVSAPFTGHFDAATDKSVGIFTTASFRVKNLHKLVGFFLKSQ